MWLLHRVVSEALSEKMARLDQRTECYELALGEVRRRVVQRRIANIKGSPQMTCDLLRRLSGHVGFLFVYFVVGGGDGVCLFVCFESSGSTLFQQQMDLQLREDGNTDGSERTES